MENKATRNCSIDIFRYVCSLLVVMIHTSAFSEVNSIIFSFFLSLTRIAVPFFFSISGYFYIKNISTSSSYFYKKLFSLLYPYFLWNILYFILLFITNVIQNHQSIISFIVECTIRFFVVGSYYHLWFFPSLFFSLFITQILYQKKHLHFLFLLSILLYICNIIYIFYYQVLTSNTHFALIFNSPYFSPIKRLVVMGIIFSTCGYSAVLIEKSSCITNKKLLIICSISGFIFQCETFICKIDILFSFALFLSILCIVILLLKNPLYSFYSISKTSKNLATFTYFSHPIFILTITALVQMVFHIVLKPSMLFILSSISIAIFYFAFSIIKKSFLRFLAVNTKSS